MFQHASRFVALFGGAFLIAGSWSSLATAAPPLGQPVSPRAVPLVQPGFTPRPLPPTPVVQRVGGQVKLLPPWYREPWWWYRPYPPSPYPSPYPYPYPYYPPSPYYPPYYQPGGIGHSR